MTSFRILIVEDEVLIADTVGRYLEQQGHEVVGHAISYEEASTLYNELQPDLTLIDIRLNGAKTGIDLALFIQKQASPKPFIYLTSQIDSQSISAAKETFPAGYLTKPIQKHTLYSTIEIAMHSYQAQEEEKEMIRLYNGKQYYQVPVEEILYLQVEHNYVRIALSTTKSVIQRSTLRETLDQLPEGQFVQTHRSFAVNLQRVGSWNPDYLYVEEEAIPISRSRRKEVMELLKAS